MIESLTSHKIYFMPKAFYILLISLLSFTATAQSIILQEDFSAGLPAGWQVIDDDGFTPNTAVAEFTSAWISYNVTTDSSMACTSYFQDTLGEAADYLILPKQTLPGITKFSWQARSLDASFPDGYYVLLSTTDSSISSFTDTLLTVNHEYFLWTERSVWLDSLGFAFQDVFIAFRNFTTDGFILELDDVLIEGADTAIANLSSESPLDFTIYPNPSSQAIFIDIEIPFQATVYSLQGSAVLRSSDKQIDITDLAVGKYLLQLVTQEGTRTKPFIKE